MNVCTWKPSVVTLHDGQQVMSDSEEWRHECEARHVMKLPRKIDRRIYLRGMPDTDGIRRGGVAAKRGSESAARLERTIMAIWQKERGMV